MQRGREKQGRPVMPKIERGNKATRFGCGFIFGLFIAVLVAASGCTPLPLIGWVVGGLIAAVVFGWLSMTRGDSFWYSIRDKWYKWF